MTYNIIEKDFQRARAAAYKLSILIGMDSLVYSVYEGASSKLLVLKSLPLPASDEKSQLAANLETAIKKEDLLAAPYGQIKITFAKSTASLIPKRLFNEEAKSTYLSELSSEENKVAIRSDEIKPLKINVVYQLNDEVTQTLSARFPKARFFNSATPFLLGSLKSLADNEQESAFVCIHKNTFQIGLFNKRELLFYNSFAYKAASDILYFTLLAFEQHGLDPNTAPLYLSGHVVDDSDIYKMLYRYVTQLHFLPAPTYFSIGKSASSVNPNFFFPLHSLLLCG